MVAFICGFILTLVLTTSGVAGEPANVQNPQVHFTCEPAGNTASGFLVFVREWGNEYKWRARRTDEMGCLFDSVTMAARESGESAGRFYLMLPHNPERSSLLKATNTAVPSAKPIFDGPDDWKRSKLLKKLGHQVGSKWDETDGRPSVQADPAPQPGVIWMQTQSISGEPLRKHAVQLIARDLGHGYSSRDTVIWAGTTDENGRIQIRQFPGACNWVVAFPELGHTQTGPVVVDPGSVTDFELNRPVRYATISGRIGDELLSSVTAETRVYLGTEHAWRYRQADIDSNGGFEITDVPIGASYNLKLTGISTEHVSVRGLLPGEHRKGVEIAQPGERAAELAEANKQLQSQQATHKGWRPTLRGRVVHLNGKAMPGVTVYATMKFHGGIRMYQVTKHATTDSEGFYEIDEADFKFGSVALMAYVPGRPLAFGAGGYFGPTEDTSVIVGIGGAMIGSVPSHQLPEVLRQPDLVVPDPEQSGVLKVCCLKDGIPREGVEVRLEIVDFHTPLSVQAALQVQRPRHSIAC